MCIYLQSVLLILLSYIEKVLYNYICSVDIQILLLAFIYLVSYTSISILIKPRIGWVSTIHTQRSALGPQDCKNKQPTQMHIVQDAAPEIITIKFQCNYSNFLIQYVYYFCRSIVVKSFKILFFGHFEQRKRMYAKFLIQSIVHSSIIYKYICIAKTSIKRLYFAIN